MAGIAAPCDRLGFDISLLLGIPRGLTCSTTCPRPGVPRPEQLSLEAGAAWCPAGALAATSHGVLNRVAHARPVIVLESTHIRHVHVAGQILAHRLVGVHNLDLDRGGCPGDCGY